jgi:hypothetical protein
VVCPVRGDSTVAAPFEIAVDYAEIIRRLEQHTVMSNERAVVVARAVLARLAERSGRVCRRPMRWTTYVR